MPPPSPSAPRRLCRPEASYDLVVLASRLGRIGALAERGIVLDVAFDRVVAGDQLGILAAGAGEQAFALADAGILLEIVGQLDRLRVGRRMLVGHVSLLPPRPTRGRPV